MTDIVEWAKNLMVSSPRPSGVELVKRVRLLALHIETLEEQLPIRERMRIYKWLDSLNSNEISIGWIKTQILHMENE